MAPNRILPLVVAWSFLFLASCALPEFKRQPIEYFALWYDYEGNGCKIRSNNNIVIRPVTANNTIDTTLMLTRKNDVGFGSIPYCRWRSTISQMVEELVHRDIAKSNSFLSVKRKPSGDNNILVTAHIHTFWLDILERPRVVIGIVFDAQREYDGKRKIFLQKFYEGSEYIEEVNPQRYAKTASDITKRIVGEFLRDLCDETN